LQDLPADEYYWRVTVTPNLKDAVPVTSIANKFTILLTDEIPEEKPVFNRDQFEKSMLPNKEKINVSEKAPIKFHWQDVDGSNAYEFKVFNGTSPGRKEVFSAKTKKNEVVFSKYASLDEGKFYWEVNSVDASLQLRLEPKGSRNENINVLLMKSKFTQVYGPMSGFFKEDDKLVNLEGFGVMEEHEALW
jgi:hypothetical protein